MMCENKKTYNTRLIMTFLNAFTKEKSKNCKESRREHIDENSLIDLDSTF